MKYAAVKKDVNTNAVADSDDSEDETDYSKFGSKKGKKAEREKRMRELEELKQNGGDAFKDTSGVIRLPNRVQKGLSVDPRTGTTTQTNDRDVVASPSNFLRGAASPRLNSQAFAGGNEDDSV